MTNYGACTRDARIARVMRLYGLSEPEAVIFMRGWVKGRRAALEAYKRVGVRRERPRVGDAAWEVEQTT